MPGLGTAPDVGCGGRPRGARCRCEAKSCEEESREDEVDDACAKDCRVKPSLGEENYGRDAEAELFEDCDGHDGPVPDRIAGDDDEQDLPRERNTDEAVEVLRVRDWRRKVAADLGLHEVLRRKDEDAVDSGGQEHATSEWHRGTSCRRRYMREATVLPNARASVRCLTTRFTCPA